MESRGRETGTDAVLVLSSDLLPGIARCLFAEEGFHQSRLNVPKPAAAWTAQDCAHRSIDLGVLSKTLDCGPSCGH